VSRPLLETIARTDPDWLDKVNANFEKLLEGPFPIIQTPQVFNAKKYEDCFGVLAGVLYYSDGTNWLTRQLDNTPDLNPATATLPDIVTAYNTLLADMQLKGMMLP